jgi:hypothetical protein
MALDAMGMMVMVEKKRVCTTQMPMITISLDPSRS